MFLTHDMLRLGGRVPASSVRMRTTAYFTRGLGWIERGICKRGGWSPCRTQDPAKPAYLATEGRERLVRPEYLYVQPGGYVALARHREAGDGTLRGPITARHVLDDCRAAAIHPPSHSHVLLGFDEIGLKHMPTDSFGLRDPRCWGDLLTRARSKL